MESSVVEVLRTPEVQRLRRIRQVGLALLVFPGAEHSRLVHSVGAAHLAIRFARQLEESCRDFLVEALLPDEAARRDFAVAALCHDLGHGPLSHVWEREVIGENFDRRRWIEALHVTGAPSALARLEWHELVAQAFLSWEEGQLHRLLEQQEEGFSERIRSFLLGGYFIPYLPRLLSSDVDVDRADYIKRDTHQTGVAYGRYDLDWLVSTCTTGTTLDNELVVGFDARKSVRVIEQFLIARRALHDTVYYHKTVRCAEGMVGLLLRRLKEVAGDLAAMPLAEFVRPVVRLVAGEIATPRELLSLDDFALWTLIQMLSEAQQVDETVRDLARRIVSRDLFKIVRAPSDKVNAFLRREGGYEEIYETIKPYCPGAPEYYLVVDTPRFSMLSSRPEKYAYLVYEDRTARPVRDHPRLRSYWGEPEEGVRVFTLSEAVASVKSLVER